MSGTFEEMPGTFEGVQHRVREILGRNRELIRNDTIETEAEQIVIAAYCRDSKRARTLTRMDLYARAREPFSQGAAKLALDYALARGEGRPLQHVLGFANFLGHEYEVSRETLVPRPETEVLVSYAVETLAKYGGFRRGFEWGIGTGVIAIELLKAFPDSTIHATDVSSSILELAQRNAARRLTSPERLSLAVSKEGVSDCPTGVDLFVSNPPYLLASSEEVTEEVRQYEPASALFAPSSDPLHWYREFARVLPTRLVEGGWVFIEVPHERAAAIAQLFQDPRWTLQAVNDLTGRQRVLQARWMAHG